MKNKDGFIEEQVIFTSSDTIDMKIWTCHIHWDEEDEHKNNDPEYHIILINHVNDSMRILYRRIHPLNPEIVIQKMVPDIDGLLSWVDKKAYDTDMISVSLNGSKKVLIGDLFKSFGFDKL
jgi:hypothetical protein